MLIKHAFAFLLSFMVSNWLYSEVMLIVPGLKPYSQRAMELFKLPTHDQWVPILNSEDGHSLKRELDSYVSEDPWYSIFKGVGVLDQEVQSMLLASRFFPSRSNVEVSLSATANSITTLAAESGFTVF